MHNMRKTALAAPTEMIRQYTPMISAVTRRMIKNPETAKDAEQEIWYEIFKSLDTFKENSKLSTWIYSIAKRTVFKYIENEKPVTMNQLKEFRALPEIEYSGSDEDKKEWIKEKCDWCLTALNQCLNKTSRLIFIFRINIDLSHKQIAQIMQMSESNVRKISSRTIEKICRFLNDTCPLYNPDGSCKCRINKYISAVDLNKEYSSVRKIIRLVDLYQRQDKELPGKNYWEKFLD